MRCATADATATTSRMAATSCTRKSRAPRATASATAAAVPNRRASGSSAAAQRADEALARNPHQHGIAEGDQHVEVGQQRDVVRQGLAEADTGIEDDGVGRDAGAAGGGGPPHQEGRDVLDDVPVGGPPLHRRGHPPHVHQDDRHPLGPAQREHAAIEPSGRHVVHQVGTGIEGRGGDLRLHGVDRQRHPDGAPDRGQHR